MDRHHMSSMADERTQGLNLNEHFGSVPDVEWLSLVMRDLDVEAFRDLEWQMPDGPRVAPFYTRAPARSIPEIRPGWDLVPEVQIQDPVAAALPHGTIPDFGVLRTGVRGGTDLRPWDEAGAGPITLAAAAFGGLSEWLSWGRDGGLLSDAGSLTVVVPVGTSFFPSIAMLRAIRIGLERVASAYGFAGAPTLLAVTATSCLTDVDPYGNLLRTTTVAMASIIGGADQVCILPFDHRTDRSDRGRRLAANISHILREEAHLGRVSDPSSGSYYVEHLTDATGKAAWSLFQEWEAAGGLGRVIADGRAAAHLAARYAARSERIESGAQVVIGLNRFQQTTAD